MSKRINVFIATLLILINIAPGHASEQLDKTMITVQKNVTINKLTGRKWYNPIGFALNQWLLFDKNGSYWAWNEYEEQPINPNGSWKYDDKSNSLKLDRVSSNKTYPSVVIA